ncbi:hypothetical protein [Christiangramia forsetii]|uniref:STAS/SEC14 domain-containing protein n=2 Tax=Christiangramia forsetii TaxID=411153 RepID=A0M1H9_CHRFK|nr:hypothetical protein [Christiangramia forsetii]GGG42483.1 hypothetical protein GCM10011532_27890 [Christiangramia forsetii]CAL66474.1 hypothetical protein GFO_1501 [Christiangramia forsetii KT0803]
MLTKEIELDFGKLYVHENILIAKLDEGILLNVQSNKRLLKLGAEIFKNKDYGYISHRVNSYAVDPMVYIDSAKTSSLKAIAVVSENEMTRKNAEGVEKKFYKDNNCFSVFRTLEEAVVWIKTRI